MTPAASVVIPAHDEELVIGRLLGALLNESGPDELDVIVVANGCDDRTAAVAGEFVGVRVIETPTPSKAKALKLGDAAATGFPRFYVDADVVLRAADVRAICEALSEPGTLAAGPTHHLPMGGVAWPVRWYYDVWRRLPGVRDELFGRGVIAVTEEGHARLDALPEVMSDDLAMAMAFDAAERVVVSGARSVISPPRTYRDLMRRRVRAMVGNRQYAGMAIGDGLEPGVPVPRRPPRTRFADLLRLAVQQPRLAPKVVLFAATAAISRRLAHRALRRGDNAWLRDESSRTAVNGGWRRGP